MGGPEAIRGFSIQLLFALLRATEPEEDWEYITIEPRGFDTVDVLLEYAEKKVAVQVKSTERVFRKSEVHHWAKLLEKSESADEYQLALFGPVSEGAATTRQVGSVRVLTPQSVDLDALTERACRRLERFFSKDLPVGVETELVVEALLNRLKTLAISGVRLSRSHFETLIRVWIGGPDIETDRLFSFPIRKHFEALRKNVEQLTGEQYHVITALRGCTRVRVVGTAGSGKTLIAAERAIRLDHAGIKTLIICHSPNLAVHLTSLVNGSEVDVFDFEAWIRLLLESDPSTSERSESPWTGYAEPYNETLKLALGVLGSGQKRWDAIIVDEGQDIRPEWWPLIEGALRDRENSQLTIFCDGRQNITGGSSDSYSRTDAVFEISKNCRNASAVHNVVRRFYVYAPMSDEKLRGGEFLVTLLRDQSTNGVTTAVKSAILKGLEYVEWTNLVILTAEGEPSTASILNDLQIWDERDAGWKFAVQHYLSVVEYCIRSKQSLKRQVFDPPPPGRYYPVLATFPDLNNSLSGNRHPTVDDVVTVQLSAKRLSRKHNISRNPVRMQWIPGDRCLRLRRYSSGAVTVPTAEQTLEFLTSYIWPESIPAIEHLKVIATEQYSSGIHENAIQLFTPSSFKGLEADGIVMFLGNDDHRIVEKSCVGLSRAKFFLHVLGSREQLARLPKLADKDGQPRTHRGS